MKPLDLFKYDMPDSFENYDVLPEAVANPINEVNFKKMNKQEKVTDNMLDEILGEEL